MGQEGRARKPESVASLTGFALGVADAMAVSSLLNLDPEDAPFGGRTGLVVILVALGITIAVKRLRTNPYVIIGIATFLPVVIASAAADQIGVRTEAGRAIRGVGLILAFVVAFLVAVWFARLKRELDQQVFMWSAVVAFFATAAVAVIYGVAQDYMGAPRISLTWLGVFGLGVFAVFLRYFERRYQ